MPSGNQKAKQSPKRERKSINVQKQYNGKQYKNNVKKHAQTAGAESNICSKDINQLLMGNPPASISAGNDDLGTMWRKTKTKEAAQQLDSYTKKGWGNYPGTPPKPDCVIL